MFSSNIIEVNNKYYRVIYRNKDIIRIEHSSKEFYNSHINRAIKYLKLSKDDIIKEINRVSNSIDISKYDIKNNYIGLVQ